MSADSASREEGPKAGEVGPVGHHYAVNLTVDGETIPLKVFLHDLIGGAITGLLQGLHNVPSDPFEVAIEVRRP